MKIEEKYFGFIYETTNLINKKKYIGKCIFKRQNNWKSYLGSGAYLKRAIKKYGKDNFVREIIFLALDEEELNQLEQEVIEISNAVKLSEYYNLKATSIGGDIFSNHPEKERIRMLRKKQMTGKGNHQFGKPKSTKMIKSVKDANSKKIVVEGKIYNSITEFSNLSGVKMSTVSFRLRSPFFDYRFLNNDFNKVEKKLKKVGNRSIKVVIDGIYYDSIIEASIALGVSDATINRRLKSEKFPNYNYHDSSK